jgi:hypothetical protein
MLPRLQTFGLLTVALSAGMAASQAQAASIVNGYFTQPAPSTYNESGWNLAVSIPGWTSNTGDTIETGLNSTYGLGSYLGSTTNLELNANRLGSVSQTISNLTVGDNYDLTFGYGIRGGAGAQQMVVEVGGVDLGTLNAPAESTSSWAPESFWFTATGTSEVLTFTSNGVGGNISEGNEITAVALSVPEPMSWALMLVGVAGIGAGLRLARRDLAAAETA